MTKVKELDAYLTTRNGFGLVEIGVFGGISVPPVLLFLLLAL